MAQTVKLSAAACTREPEPASEPDAGLGSPLPGSQYEAILSTGFASLRFPKEVEAHYQLDAAVRREKVLRTGVALALFLNIGLLLPDWLMVPDMLHAALWVRLLACVLPLAIGLLLFDRVDGRWRERFIMVMDGVSAVIIVWLCSHSLDSMAPPYLVSLAMILLFNGGVIRMRFWPALGVDAVVLALFAFAVSLQDPVPVVLMSSITLVLVSTTVFALYGSYRQEHEERTNWLMLQHEHLLLEELELGNRRLDELSRHDPLTGLANRRHVNEFLQQVWDRARQSGDSVAVLMMDIDHFKAFNDHYGHPEGDACLRDVAQALETHLRQPGDMVGRFGGEEFIAVLNQTSLEAATAAAERVRTGVHQLARRHGASPTARNVTVSIGVARVRPGAHEISAERLLALADKALYKAKSGGRDRVVAELNED